MHAVLIFKTPSIGVRLTITSFCSVNILVDCDNLFGGMFAKSTFALSFFELLLGAIWKSSICDMSCMHVLFISPNILDEETRLPLFFVLMEITGKLFSSDVSSV